VISSSLSPPPPLPRLTKLHVTRDLSLAYAVTMLLVLYCFPYSAFYDTALDTIMESKRKCKSDDKAKKNVKVPSDTRWKNKDSR
jgi:hypothetical protein